tara:strand:- start:165 stop:1013 length:849 start_codon:yes stop_codon:yes gene_type:complete
MKKSLVKFLFIFLILTLGVSHANQSVKRTPIKAVLFDVFGTVVDWRGSMVTAFNVLFEQKKVTNISAETFVLSWVKAYSDNMTLISDGKKKFATVDVLNKQALDDTLKYYHIYHQFSDHDRLKMWRLWRNLKPWPDSLKGINLLKTQMRVGTLSNGNVSLLQDLSHNVGIEWDIIISGETFRRYKPDPKIYLSAANMLHLKPNEILLVASHKYDLVAASKSGYKTAYIFRPKESSTLSPDQLPKKNEFDFVVNGIDELAMQLTTSSVRGYPKSVPPIRELYN